MLSVYLGEMEQAIYYPPAYFDNQYENKWITDKLSVEMIKDVDKSEIIGAHLIESSVLGQILFIQIYFRKLRCAHCMIDMSMSQKHCNRFICQLRHLRNASSRINTVFFCCQKQITSHWIWYNRVAKS